MDTLTVYNSPYNEIRLGKLYDGGYVICDIPNIVYDHFISGGISNDISFECDIINLYTDLNCDAFDGTVNGLPYPYERITFHKLNLGNTNSADCTDLSSFLETKKNVFMKIDIEGHEFRVLPSLIEKGLMNNIAQLIIEIHTPGDIHLFPDYFKGLADIDNNVMFKTLSKLNETHVLVHLHPNNGCRVHVIDGIKVPNVFECTYIRKVDGVTYTKNTSPIPSRLDMKNLPENPEITLEGYPYVFPKQLREELAASFC